MNYEIKKEQINLVVENLFILMQKNKTNIIFLDGQLGSGKTFLAQAIAKKLKIREKIISPSFNYINIYTRMIHIDAYNFKSTSLEEFEEYFEDKIIVVEWASLIKKFNLPYIAVNIDYLDSDDKRKYTISVQLKKE